MDEEAALNPCFVMIRQYQKKELRNLLGYLWLKKELERIPDAQIAKQKVQSFAQLALVQAYMLTRYWRARVLLSKSAAQVNYLPSQNTTQTIACTYTWTFMQSTSTPDVNSNYLEP